MKVYERPDITIDVLVDIEDVILSSAKITLDESIYGWGGADERW